LTETHNAYIEFIHKVVYACHTRMITFYALNFYKPSSVNSNISHTGLLATSTTIYHLHQCIVNVTHQCGWHMGYMGHLSCQGPPASTGCLTGLQSITVIAGLSAHDLSHFTDN